MTTKVTEVAEVDEDHLRFRKLFDVEEVFLLCCYVRCSVFVFNMTSVDGFAVFVMFCQVTGF